MNKVFFAHVDWSLLVPVLILSLMSLATLLSINGEFFRNQFFFTLLSLLVFLFFTNVDCKITQRYAFPIYIISLILLSFVLFMGIESRGAMRWIDIFGIRVQFSEILKPFLILCLASYVSASDRSSFKAFVKIALLIFPISLLIIVQPDLGNGLIYLSVAFFTLVAYGFSWSWFFGGLLSIALLMPVFWQFLHEYQRRRILTFISPASDPLGISYNSIQSMIAIGSGQFFGKGFGEGTQSGFKFLPERHTDFIFATLSENFGFVGILIVFACFTALLYRIYVIFSETDDVYEKLICICAFFLFLIQFFINCGMNMGIVPIVGVTLPFVSYGGSSVLSNFILLGILSSISKTTVHRDTLEIR